MIGFFAAHSIFCSRDMSVRPGHVSIGSKAGASGDHRPIGQHVFRQRDHDRTGPAVGRDMKGARHDFRNARGIVNLGRPFRHGAEHRAIIEFLKGFALAHIARHLTDENDHRRRILTRDVNARRCIGGARTARDKADARPARRLADGFRHHRRPALLPADGEFDRAVVERIERGEIALAGHAESVAHAMRNKLIDEDFAAGSRTVIAAHGVPVLC